MTLGEIFWKHIKCGGPEPDFEEFQRDIREWAKRRVPDVPHAHPAIREYLPEYLGGLGKFRAETLKNIKEAP